MQQQWKRPLLILGAIIILVAAGYAISGLKQQMAGATTVLLALKPETISVALLLSILSALLSGALWWKLVHRLGHHLSFRTMLATYLNAGLAGYVVNLAGPAVGCAVTLRRHGISPTRSLLLMLLANALGFLGTLVWAPIGLILLARPGMQVALPLIGRHDLVAVSAVFLVLTMATLAVVHALSATTDSCNRVSRFLRGRLCADSGSEEHLRFRDTLALIPLSAASWVTGAAALYVVLAGMQPAAAISFRDVVGATMLAATVGSLAFFAPEGVGVKDGLLVALLAQSTGVSLATCVGAALAVRARSADQTDPAGLYRHRAAGSPDRQRRFPGPAAGAGSSPVTPVCRAITRAAAAAYCVAYP